MRFRTLSVTLLVSLAPAFAGERATIRIDGGDGGRRFEGVGAVSAGASSRLLVDYREPYRSQVLDLLLKPRFGAGFQHLKVEIGGGENSTCGSEPSHAVTRAELANPKPRGYEFWLMKEARARNPRIILDCLPWSFPGWLSGKFTTDSAEWFVAFLDVASKQYGLTIDWISAAENENGTDRDWIVRRLRPLLDRRGYRAVKLQAPDDDSGFWEIFRALAKDPRYAEAIQAVGYHYVNGREPWMVDMEPGRQTTEAAKSSGKPLWASEEWSTGGGKWDPQGALYVARLINKLYIRDRITKVELWAPVDSIYKGLLWDDSGAMRADTPWSGHYEVWPAAWAVAHTTQFAEPGWSYLDGACGRIRPNSWNGSYVTLRDPVSGDWSMVVTTGEEATLAASITGGLKTGKVHVWASNAERQFVEQASLDASTGSFQLKLGADSIYTFTTTTGQRKGVYPVPKDEPFPFPYADGFEEYASGATPRFFADQKGTFEVAAVPGRGKCLRQIVPSQGYMWVYQQKIVQPYTVIGDSNWKDYSVSADVWIEDGEVEVGGRFDGNPNELSYRFMLAKQGGWKLNHRGKTLASGVIPGFQGSSWHNMMLVMAGERLQGYVDRKRLVDMADSSARAGMAYLASTYDPNLFDNFRVDRP